MILDERVLIDERYEDEIYDNQSKSFYASITCFKHIKKIKNVHRIVIDDCIFYVSINEQQCDVYVAMREIDNNILDSVCDYIFAKYKVKRIFLDHLYNQYISKKYSPIKTGVNSDVLMVLKDSVEEYHASLGKNTRKHVKYYFSRIKREYENVEYNTFIKNEITYELIEDMFKFNKDRLLKARNINREYTSEEVESVFKCAKEKGVLTTISINGVVSGLALIQNIGNDYYLTDIGSDSEYDKYNIGQICLVLSIEYAINNKDKGSKYHFMFELTDYKKRFGGEMVELYPYYVYKNKNIEFLINKVKYFFIERTLWNIKRNEKVKTEINRVRSAR